MPINCALKLRCISDKEFADIDAVVMKCAYATHNRFGRMFDEKVYENDLAERIRAEGLQVHTQVPISLSHAGFEKTYFLDLVVNEMLYELKVVSSLLGEHDAQSLNYAMLQNIRLVKLINFGEARVRGKLLRNAVMNEDRYQAIVDRAQFNPLGVQCVRLVEHLQSLVDDWGTHLSCRLYNKAMIYEFGGEANCLQRIELFSRKARLGTHIVQLYDTYRAFAVTGFTTAQGIYRQHLQVLLEHAERLDSFQWLNLNGSRMELMTLELRAEPLVEE